MTKEPPSPAPTVPTRPKFGHLVVDSGPLIQNVSLTTLGNVLYTVPEVLAEIRDEATRERLARLPVGWIRLATPSPDALSAVREFARGTGDAASLSPVDLRVVALTLTLEQEHNQDYVLSMEPSMSVHQGPEEGRGSHERDKGKPAPGKRGKSSARADDGWITPENIAQVTMASFGNDGDPEAQTSSSPCSTVGCISTDFAIQNVLLQMRLKAIGPEGYRIRQLKNWLLRCHACYWTTRQMERRFCDRCGNPTLIRTSYRVTDDGQVHLFLKRNFQYNNRGTIAAMPLPRGAGVGERVLFLREDQKEYQRAMRGYERQERKMARSVGDLDAIDDRLAAVFGAMSVKERGASQDGPTLPVIGFGRRNPNRARRRV